MRLKVSTFVEVCVMAAAVVLSLPTLNIASEPNDVPTSGFDPPRELRPLDRSIKELIVRWHIPGASVAVFKSGKPIFVRGYGYADLQQRVPVVPDKSLFRIASISKSITAAAVFKLVEQKKLRLDDKVAELLSFDQYTGRHCDKRLSTITVGQLLDMSAGWDKDRSGDPILQPYIARAAKRMRQSGPADFDTTMHYVLSRRLDFAPGTRHAYSNFTYGLLGKIIEKTSGMEYEAFVRDKLFEPSGVQLYKGHTRQEDRLPNEVVYYAPLESTARSILPSRTRRVAAPYGRAYLEADLPMLGWVATAPELAQLVDRMTSDDTILTPESRGEMFARPALACWQRRSKYFAKGWEVRTTKDGECDVYKDGTLPGTRAFVEHTAGGITWVALFNGRPPQKLPDKFSQQVQQALANGLEGMSPRQQCRLARELQNNCPTTQNNYTTIARQLND